MSLTTMLRREHRSLHRRESPSHHAQAQRCTRSREVTVQLPYLVPDPFDVGRCRPEVLQAQYYPECAAVRFTGSCRAAIPMITYVAPDGGAALELTRSIRSSVTFSCFSMFVIFPLVRSLTPRLPTRHPHLASVRPDENRLSVQAYADTRHVGSRHYRQHSPGGKRVTAQTNSLPHGSARSQHGIARNGAVLEGK